MKQFSLLSLPRRASLGAQRRASLASVCLAPVAAFAIVASFAGTGVASPVPVASPEARAPIALGAKDLAFTPTELRLYKDPDTGKHYWYMTYEVVNKTGKEVRFSPRVELVVDDGVVLSQGEGVPSDVVQKLKKHLGDELLEDHFEILGEVLPGKENAKSGLVVFRADSLSPTELTVMVQGLSRDSRKEPHPKTGEPVVLRKTARLDYLVAGDPRPRGATTYPIVNQEWIFR
ncbi:MAG: hypothetical protein RL136_2023 [Planctomycetota bacterium]|jgi:hypothetical protein